MHVSEMFCYLSALDNFVIVECTVLIFKKNAMRTFYRTILHILMFVAIVNHPKKCFLETGQIDTFLKAYSLRSLLAHQRNVN